MAYEILTLNPTEEARIELKSYNDTIPMGSLAIGVDNIHHDVFLSPKFVQSARDYLFRSDPPEHEGDLFSRHRIADGQGAGQRGVSASC